MALDEAKFAEEYYDDNPNKTWGTSFVVDGSLYATNLFWQPLQNVEDPYSDVEQAAQNIMEGADLFCVTKGKSPQFGICISSEGYEKSQNVAAATVSSALSGFSSVVGVFKVDQGWWYVCIRNDIILSDGDMLFTNEEDAKAQFASMMAVPDWDKRIAPEEWAIEGSETVDFSALLAKGANVKLQKINSLRGGKLATVFIISGFLSLWILYSLVDAIFLTPPKKPIIAVAPKKKKPVVAPKKIEKPAPWKMLPASEPFMINCYKSTLDFISVMPPGWDMSTVKCNKNTASTGWSKKIGKVSWMKKALDDSNLSFSSTSFNDAGNIATANLSFGKAVLKENPPRIDREKQIFMFNDFFQSIGIAVRLNKSNFSFDGESKVYKMVNFAFSSDQNPVSWVALLTKYSGLVVNNIEYDPKSGIWNYEGVIYVL